MATEPTRRMEHCLLVIRKGRNDGSINDVALESSSTTAERLVLLPGENWLQWNETECPMPSILSLAAEVTDMVHLPPSHDEINSSIASSYTISSSLSISSTNEEEFHRPRRTVAMERCYLCIDVDASMATIKDMRDPLMPDGEVASSTSPQWTAHILDHPLNSVTIRTFPPPHLVRRCMRVLKDTNRILFRHPISGAICMELEYRQGSKDEGDHREVHYSSKAEPKVEASSSSSPSTSIPTKKRAESLLETMAQHTRGAFQDEAFTTQSPMWESAPLERRPDDSQGSVSARHPQFNIQRCDDDGMLSTLSSQQNTEEDMPSQEIAGSSSQIPFGSLEPTSAVNGLLLTQPDRAPADAAEAEDNDDDSTIDPRNTFADTRTSLPSSRLMIKEVALPIERREMNVSSVPLEKKSSAKVLPVALETTATPERNVYAVAYMDTVSSSVCSPDLLADNPMVPPVKNTPERVLGATTSHPVAATWSNTHDQEHYEGMTTDEASVLEEMVETAMNPTDTTVVNLLENPLYCSTMTSISLPSNGETAELEKEASSSAVGVDVGQDVSNPEKEPVASVDRASLVQDASDPEKEPAPSVGTALDQDVSNNPEILDRPPRSSRKRKVGTVSIGGTIDTVIVQMYVACEVLTRFHDIATTGSRVNRWQQCTEAQNTKTIANVVCSKVFGCKCER
jgi:hypothetical protein